MPKILIFVANCHFQAVTYFPLYSCFTELDCLYVLSILGMYSTHPLAVLSHLTVDGHQRHLLAVSCKFILS